MLLQENTSIDKSMSSQPPPPEEDQESPERSDMFFEADDIDSITNDDSDDKPEDDVDTRFLEVSIGKFTLLLFLQDQKIEKLVGTIFKLYTELY